MNAQIFEIITHLKRELPGFQNLLITGLGRVRAIYTHGAREWSSLEALQLWCEAYAERVQPVNLDSRTSQFWPPVEAAVCRALRVTALEMHSRMKTARVAGARQVAMYLVRALDPEQTLVDIGRHYGMDHGTVMHAVKAVNARRETEPKFREVLRGLLENVSEKSEVAA